MTCYAKQNSDAAVKDVKLLFTWFYWCSEHKSPQETFLLKSWDLSFATTYSLLVFVWSRLLNEREETTWRDQKETMLWTLRCHKPVFISARGCTRETELKTRLSRTVDSAMSWILGHASVCRSVQFLVWLECHVFTWRRRDLISVTVDHHYETDRDFLFL